MPKPVVVFYSQKQTKIVLKKLCLYKTRNKAFCKIKNELKSKRKE